MMEKVITILSLVAALLTVLGNVFELLKILSNLWKPNIPRINLKLEELTKLEQYLDDDEQPTIHLQKKYLTDTARESLSHEIYMRRGMSLASRCGSLAWCFIGVEVGAALTLLMLTGYFYYEGQENEAIRCFVILIVAGLIIILTVKADCWIYARITLERQFRLDIHNPFRNAKGRLDKAFEKMMSDSFECLLTYEKKRNLWRIILLFLWAVLTVLTCIDSFMGNFPDYKSVSETIDKFTTGAYLIMPFLLLFISAVLLSLSGKEEKASEGRQSKYDTECADGNIESQIQVEESGQSQIDEGKQIIEAENKSPLTFCAILIAIIISSLVSGMMNMRHSNKK